MPQKLSNAARSALTGAVLSTDTSVAIEAAKADLFPVANTGTNAVNTANLDWFKAVLQDGAGNIEIVYVRTRAAASAVLSNVIRAQEGTTARAFAAGAVIGLRVTAADIEEKAKAGANADITSITGLTTALSVGQGGTGVTSSTGSGSTVLNTSPTLVTPALGTPTALVGTNITGTAAAFNINGTVGATTPATGAFTTVSASGLMSANADLKVVNGSNDFGSIQLGTSALYLFTGGPTFSGYRFEVPSGQYDFQVSGVPRALVSSTGLAVTGALSYTTTLTGGTDVVNLGSGQVYKDASGNVGIGTASPTGRLEVKGVGNISGKTLRLTDSVGNETLSVLDGGTVAVAYGPFTVAGTMLNVAYGTATGLYVNSSGNVGIGTASPSVKLQVNGSGQILRVTDGTTGASIYSGGGLFGFNNQTGEDGMFGSTASHYVYFVTGGAERVRIDSSGNLGIGITNPTAARLVVGETANTSAFKYASFNSNATESGSITRVGTTAAVLYNTTSDGDLKNILGDADRHAAAARIMAYRMKEYEFKTDAGRRFVGPIAQDTFMVNRDPMLVTPGTDTSAWQINMSGFIPDLIMHMQNLQAQLDELAGGKVLANKPAVFTKEQLSEMVREFAPIQAASDEACIARTAYEDKTRADHCAAEEAKASVAEPISQPTQEAP